MSGGKKSDENKPRLHLVPERTLVGIARAFEHGADKYGVFNWRKGFKWSRLADASLRHLYAWLEGQECDPDSGLHHLDHLACNVAMLIEHSHKGMGTDDRHTTINKPTSAA